MNVPDLDNPPPSEVQQPSPAAILNSTVETVLAPAESNGASRSGRAHGKVARLPKATRDQINFWMRDGLSYPDIIQRLGPQGEGLTPNNLSEWKRRAHQDWLVEQAFIERTRARQETPADLVRDFDATSVSHAALQLGTLHMFEALRDLSSSLSSSSSSLEATDEDSITSPDSKLAREAPPSPPLEERRHVHVSSETSPARQANLHDPALNPKSKFKNQRSALDLRLGGDSAAFVRLMNALARTSRETMLLQKYREACAKAREAIQVLKDPKRKLTDSERLAIVSHVDDILGIRWDNNEQPTPSDLGSSSSGPSSSPPFPAPVCRPDAQQSPEHAPTGAEVHRTPERGENIPAPGNETEPSLPSSTQPADSPSSAAENVSEETLIAQLSS